MPTALHTLNPPQRTAVQHLTSPLLVLAGAGSGKTRVITQKIAWLIENDIYRAPHIAAITFTNKAAREMQTRVGQLLPRAACRGLTVATFHALGLLMLRQDAILLGYKPNFSIFDAADCQKLLLELSQHDKNVVNLLQQQISRWKNANLTPAHVISQAKDELTHLAARTYQTYQDTLQAYQAFDFDDLIRLPVTLLQENQQARERWQHKFRYLLVDEYQDTNTCQYDFLRGLAGQEGRFTAVGDDDQAIYAWRGASSDNLQRLQHDYPRLQIIKLEQNYRSVGRILRAANQLITHNPKLFTKQLWSDLGIGDPIVVNSSKDEHHEAEATVMRLLAHKTRYQSSFGDYAILYRSNHQARVFEHYLRQAQVPYVLSGGTSFFERSEIKDILAYLRLLANEDDDPAFIRAITTPKRGIGQQTLEKLGQYAANRHLSLFTAAFESGFSTQVTPQHVELVQDFCQFINRMQFRATRENCTTVLQDLLRAIEYETWLFDNEEPRQAENKWKNIQEFCQWLGQKAEGNQENESRNLLEMTQYVTLLTALDGRQQSDQDTVKLSTLHAAKGLEYPHVFLVGVEEGILPHRESLDGARLEEERRLMYVGITRARFSLTISYCQRRKRAGEWDNCDPSRFIAELPTEDLERRDNAANMPSSDRRIGNAHLKSIHALLAKNKNMTKKT